MITSDPKLPQFSPTEPTDAVSRTYWLRFQERFYTLWRELARNDIELRASIDAGAGSKLYLHRTFGGF